MTEAARQEAFALRRALGFGRLFDAISDAVVVADLESRIVLWNPAATAMFGYTPEEAIGANLDIIVPPALRERHHAGVARYRATGEARLVGKHTPLVLPALAKDGRDLIVELTLSELEQEGERLVLGILRDVTERVRLQEALTRERRELARANDSLEAFSYVVSHDLREPVRAIEGLLESLDEDHARGLDDDGRALLERTRAASRRLRLLLAHLLEYSRAGRQHPPEVLDVRQVLEREDCVGQFADLLRERGARLEVASGIPAVLASPAALCQALGNLVANAIRHNPRPSPNVWVHGEAAEGGKRVDVFVEDDGPGFPAEIARRVRARALEPRRGGGFGLPIVLRAAEQMGAEVELGASPRGGARVRLRLPAGE